MSYHVVKKIKGKNYHYLVHNKRIGKKEWKRFDVYLGSGSKTKKEIERLTKQHTPDLNKKIDDYLRSVDPLYTLLSSEQVKLLDNIKKSYSKKLKTIDKIEFKSFEEWFITEFTYDSNAIEGNTLTKTQVSLLLFEGRVPKDKNLREIHEAENHKKAYEYVRDYSGELDQLFILKIHEILLSNIWDEYAGRIRDKKVYIRGADFIPPPPQRVESELNELLKWYKKNRRKYHPVILAAYTHAAFESVHPFVDGNGRTGRLMINFILRKNGLPQIDIRFADREKYIETLKKTHKDDLKPLVDLIVEGVKENRLVELPPHKK